LAIFGLTMARHVLSRVLLTASIPFAFSVAATTLTLDDVVTLAIQTPYIWSGSQCELILLADTGPSITGSSNAAASCAANLNLTIGPAGSNPVKLPFLGLGCVRPATNAAPCVATLKLDNLYYPLNGDIAWNAGTFTIAGTTLSNCRRASGASLPATQMPKLVVGTTTINLSPTLTFDGIAYSNDMVWRAFSSTGDIICDGTVIPPFDAIFAANFE
jgi:hypothetical protein